MTEQDNGETERILALLVDAAEHDQTAQEAEEELVADGVNVTAFLASVHGAVQQQQKEDRLAWRREARRNADEFAQTQQWMTKYAEMTRAELMAEARQYASEIHFKNFQEATDDDLRTQLADHARLQELAKNKK
jgi:6-phosphogluconate dehydrogenase